MKKFIFALCIIAVVVIFAVSFYDTMGVVDGTTFLPEIVYFMATMKVSISIFYFTLVVSCLLFIFVAREILNEVASGVAKSGKSVSAMAKNQTIPKGIVKIYINGGKLHWKWKDGRYKVLNTEFEIIDNKIVK